MNRFLTICALMLGTITPSIYGADLKKNPVVPNVPVKERIILCLGDSLTEGYGVPAEKSWPSLLQESLSKSLKSNEKPIKVVNSGISGATSASGPGRLKWHLKSPDKPEIMILALGANDGLRGQSVDAMKENLGKTISMAKDAGIRTVLAGMKIPPNYGQKYADSFEKVFVDLSKEHGIALIPFLLDGVAAKKELNLPDGIHPNPKGYEIVIANVMKVVAPLLKDK